MLLLLVVAGGFGCDCLLLFAARRVLGTLPVGSTGGDSDLANLQSPPVQTALEVAEALLQNPGLLKETGLQSDAGGSTPAPTGAEGSESTGQHPAETGQPLDLRVVLRRGPFYLWVSVLGLMVGLDTQQYLFVSEDQALAVLDKRVPEVRVSLSGLNRIPFIPSKNLEQEEEDADVDVQLGLATAAAQLKFVRANQSKVNTYLCVYIMALSWISITVNISDLIHQKLRS